MLHVRMFASIKELTNTEEEFFPYENIETVTDLKKNLSLRGHPWETVFGGGMVVKAAVNKQFVADDFELRDGDEVAFFPPVTGG
ncbi:MAG: hypothetical protein CBC01_06695 [Betaproteobacteria bacterium TMED41]|nr:MAG: hypothetical protein CBC01_06695 [Betaproteobacteria bacterium TMED41]|tara:strand:+ start:859 stop:1110 length:252 start_codon:yes stop_codon:yes gene_type:complete